MLYPDSEKRIEDINRIAELFEHKRYPETAKEVRAFIEILKGDKIPVDFSKKLDSLFDLHQKEFEVNLPVGQSYRKRCFEEIKEIVFKAIGRLGSDYPKVILTNHPLLQRLNSANKITGSIAEELASKRIADKTVVFHLHCYAYLIFVEGIFDELSRVLYFLAFADKTNVPKLEDLEKMTVWDILTNLKTTFVFLERWDEKNHIRNAIGHARASYDSTNNQVRFIDADKHGVITWDSNDIPFSKFAEMALELEDSLTAFLNIFLLLKIYDLIRSANPYA
jgi:hypothetical protein